MTRTIDRRGLEAAIEAGAVAVVETLRAEHFEQGHLPGAAEGKDDWGQAGLALENGSGR